MLAPASWYLAVEPIDLRCGIDRLLVLVQAVFGRDAFDGSAYIFRNRSGSRIKLVLGDAHGRWIRNGSREAASGELADAILVKAPDLFCHSGIPLTRCMGVLHSGVACACGWHPAMKLACPSRRVTAKTRGATVLAVCASALAC